METYMLRLSALVALIPAALFVFRAAPKRDLVFWSVMGVALMGTLSWVYVRQSAGWSTGISTALWLTVAACLIIFAFIAAISEDAWRWTPLLLPYLLVLAILATAWGQAPEVPLTGGAPLAWIGTHLARIEDNVRQRVDPNSRKFIGIGPILDHWIRGLDQQRLAHDVADASAVGPGTHRG